MSLCWLLFLHYVVFLLFGYFGLLFEYGYAWILSSDFVRFGWKISFLNCWWKNKSTYIEVRKWNNESIKWSNCNQQRASDGQWKIWTHMCWWNPNSIAIYPTHDIVFSVNQVINKAIPWNWAWEPRSWSHTCEFMRFNLFLKYLKFLSKKLKLNLIYSY